MPTNELDELRREIAALRDKNAQLRAAAAISESDLGLNPRRLAKIVENAPAFVAVFRGPTHVFEVANAAYRNLTGGRALLGKPVAEVIPEARGQGYLELLDSVLASGVAHVGIEAPIVLDLGRGAEQRYVTFVYQPITEADGRRDGIFALGFDVTEATLARQRLRAQFNSGPTPTFVWQGVVRGGTREFLLTDVNQAALAEYGEGLAARIGESAEPAMLADIIRCFDRGATFDQEVTITTGGSEKRVSVTYAAAPPDLVIMQMEDITERIKREEKIRLAQKLDAVGRLAGGVAHDFNNLLSVITGYTELLLEEPGVSAALREDLLEMRLAGRRAKDLTTQLLAFSRQQVLQPRVIDIGEALRSLEAMLGRLIGEDIELLVTTQERAGCVLADRGQIEQVIVNLALNARDAMPDGGILAIDVTRALVDGNEVVRITVQDNGVGMDKVLQARVFEPFFTTKEAGKGTGLGLATVFGIVRQSGGHLDVTSEVGRGSIFDIYLPRTERSAEAPEEPLSAASLHGSATILLVEDEDQVRAVACMILRRHGYHVLEAANAGEALLIAEQHRGVIALLVTDVVMPRFSGRKLAEALTARLPAIQVLFVSGYTDDVVLRAGVRHEGVAFLQKPFTPRALLEKVREVLGGLRISDA